MRWVLGLVCFCSILFSEEETVEPPKSIAREILQPIGMPLVVTYHNIKESSFMNMKRKGASGFEAIGDFFLAPSRYLFGGKTIKNLNGQYEAFPSFSYRRKEALKASLSVLALPVCEVLGCFFKGLSFLSKETRHEYRAIQNSIENQNIISHLDHYRRLGLTAFKCEQTAPSLGYIRPSVLPQKHLIEIEAFKEVCQLLNQHDVLYFLDCGSCLGAYRYGGMIPWDEDIDISILAEDHDNVKKILSKLDPDQFQIQDWSSYKYPKTFLKLYIRKTKTLIDIYHYNLDPQTRTAAYFYTYKDTPIPDSWKKGELAMTKPIPYDVLFPLQKATFDNISTWVPHQLETFLHYKYGENLSPTMIWDEKTASYRKVKDHPYWKIVE